MKIVFRLLCHTKWGQEVYITFPSQKKEAPMIKMEYTREYIWLRDITLSNQDIEGLAYSYIIVDSDGLRIKDGAGTRILSIMPEHKERLGEIILNDTWISPSDPSTLFFTSFFTDVVFGCNVKDGSVKKGIYRRMPAHGIQIELRVFVPWVRGEEGVFIAGDIPELGGWDTRRSFRMKKVGSGVWSAHVFIDNDIKSVEYKYIIKHEEKNQIQWEEGKNRCLDLTRGDLIFVNDNIFRPGILWRGAGVAIPVFSLRGVDSLGTGEFTDLKPLADWASRSGFKVIQILPVNDTTRQYGWMDAYPYSCISVFALHPLYLNIDAIGDIQKDIKKELGHWKKALNNHEFLEYEEVMRIKIDILRRVFSQKKDDFLKSEDFRWFFSENAFWLKSYALFCALRDTFKTGDFSSWKGYRDISNEEIEILVSPESEYYGDVCFHYFLQYHLHRQLMEASLYAKGKGIALKGDIPIGVHPNSHDCWVYPEIFHMDRSAGAPPDPFSDHGQNWGFPTYNWERMAEDNYQWWRGRLKNMSRYFQLVRLDHVLGFFRIWEIPKGMYSGIMGRFNPALPVTEDELKKEGIEDFVRLCNPYITSTIIDEIFGPLRDYVKEIFLETDGDGLFRLKPGFSDQEKIDIFLESQDDKDAVIPLYKGQIREGLFGLLSNLILFKDEKGKGFHFRINMMHTTSFKSLERWEQDRLIALYNDYFYHRQDNLWRNNAMIKLPVLKEASKMLICGEDLGMIPDCVPPVMKELCILGLRIQRMPKETDREFGYPWDYHYLTVCTTSSHDMPTLRGWWEEDPERAARFYKNILKKDGTPPKECTPEVAGDIVMQHLESPSMLAIFPLQDLLAMSNTLRRKGDPLDEQINNPANPFHRWRYRMHIALDELLNNKDFSDMLKDMIEKSGRLKS